MRCRWTRQAARAVQAFLGLKAPPTQPPQMISIGPVTLDLRARRALVDGFTVHLPAREAALLMSLMGNAGRVLTIDELARAAGLDRTDQARTRRYMERLRRRLIVHPIGPVLVERVGKVGYRFSLCGTAALHAGERPSSATTNCLVMQQVPERTDRATWGQRE